MDSLSSTHAVTVRPSCSCTARLPSGLEEWEAQRPLGRRGLPPARARPSRLRAAARAAEGEDFLRRRRRHRRAHGRRRPPRRSFLRRVGRDVRRRPPSRSDQVAHAARARRFRGRPRTIRQSGRSSTVSVTGGTRISPTRSGSSGFLKAVGQRPRRVPARLPRRCGLRSCRVLRRGRPVLEPQTSPWQSWPAASFPKLVVSGGHNAGSTPCATTRRTHRCHRGPRSKAPVTRSSSSGTPLNELLVRLWRTPPPAAMSRTTGHQRL